MTEENNTADTGLPAEAAHAADSEQKGVEASDIESKPGEANGAAEGASAESGNSSLDCAAGAQARESEKTAPQGSVSGRYTHFTLLKETEPQSDGEKEPGFTDKAVVVLEKLASQRHVLALRDGMLASIPIILVGSTFLLLGAQGDVINQYLSGNVSWLPNLAATSFGQRYLANSGDFYVPYRLTMGLLGLYIAFTVACALAKQYNMAPVPQGLGAAAALLATEAPQRVAWQSGEETVTQWAIAIKPLGPEGIFLGIVTAFLMVEISRLFAGRKKQAQTSEENAEEALKSSIPPAVADAFRSFLPMLVLVAAIWSLRHIFNFNINAAMLSLMSPLVKLGDTLGAVLVSNFFLHLFAVAGIHGISVINAVMLPLWQQFVAANAEAHSAGLALPHVTAYPFYQWFIWLGGSGATLAPTVLLFFFRKNAHFRSVGKISIIPALFNVNEPFLFGLPVIANPILALPCIIAPMLCGLTSWYAVTLGMVSAPFLEVPWVMPCFLGALLSTQDLRSLVLLGVNFAISAAVWYPFLRYTDRRSRNTEE